MAFDNAELLLDTHCRYGATDVMTRRYNLLYLLRRPKDKKVIGTLGVVQESPYTISVDIWFRSGKCDNVEFIRWGMSNHKGYWCVFTCKKTDLSTRMLGRTLGFDKIDDSENFYLYMRRL